MSFERLLARLLSFFASLAIGTSAVSILRSDDPTRVSYSDSNDVRFHEAPTPEFIKPVVDDQGSGHQLVYSSVFKGKSAICRSEKPSFSNRYALALFKRGESFSLERTAVTWGELVKTETSSFYPLKFNGSRNALFLLSDNGSLKSGRVQTVYIEPWNSNVPDDKLFLNGLRIGDSRQYQLGNKNYTFRVSTGPPSPAGPVPMLELETSEQKQTIWYRSIFDMDDEVGELDWVGDLDADGRIDLFRYFEVNGGGSVDVLFLSSHAKPGNLVGSAAFSFVRDCR